MSLALKRFSKTIRGKELLLLALIGVGYFAYSLLIPVVQTSNNKHSSTGDLISMSYYLISLCSLIFSLIVLFKQKNVPFFFLLLLLAATFAYWNYQLQALSCVICARA